MINESVLAECFRSRRSWPNHRISPLTDQFQLPRPLLFIIKAAMKTNKGRDLPFPLSCSVTYMADEPLSSPDACLERSDFLTVIEEVLQLGERTPRDPFRLFSLFPGEGVSPPTPFRQRTRGSTSPLSVPKQLLKPSSTIQQKNQHKWQNKSPPVSHPLRYVEPYGPMRAITAARIIVRFKLQLGAF